MNRIRVTAPRARSRSSPDGSEHPSSLDRASVAIHDPEIIEGYLSDASGLRGEAEALHRPADEAALAQVVAQASAAGRSITPSAARTSTTASAVPHGGVIVSTERLARLISIDTNARRARAEAGILLGDFQRAIEAEGFFYPPDPTSRNECTLGGSVACNASGARTFLYGASRCWVEGLRVVLCSGEVLALQRGQVVAAAGEDLQIEHTGGRVTSVPVPAYRLPDDLKHAGGYATGPGLDLIDLFIGSEGTLGIISEVEVAIRPSPERVLALWIGFPDEHTALAWVASAREGRGDVEARCIEWLDGASLQLIRARVPELVLADAARCAVYVEAECRADDEPDVMARWSALLDGSGALVDLDGGVLVAADATQRERFRAARHAVPAGVNERAAQNGMPKLGTDLAVPAAHLDEMLELYRRAASDPWGLLGVDERAEVLTELGVGRREDAPLPEALDTVTFGHIGDGHVHVNFLPVSAAGLVLARAVYAHLTDAAIAFGGSPSAEHGIGKIKHDALRALVGEEGIAQMRAVKRALDPTGGLGRGNLFTP